MKLEPKIGIDTAFRRLYNYAFENVVVSERADLSRAKYLRCSALPFCPFSLIEQLAVNHEARFLDFRGTYYTTVGTAVHNVMQTALMQATVQQDMSQAKRSVLGNIVGDWKCLECGSEKKLATQPYCCDFPMQYEELEISFKGIRGHLDTLYLFGDTYAVVDYKTTSLANADTISNNPPEGYIEQILAYALLLRLQYKIKVDYLLLCFVPRDNPQTPYLWKRKVTKDMLQDMQHKLKKYLRWHKAAMRIKTKLELLDLIEEVGPCNNPFCSTCGSSLKSKMLTIHETYKHKFPLGKLLK